MTYLKRLGLIAAAIAFFMSISAVSSNAQYYRDRSWQNRGYYRQTVQYRRYRRARISPWQYRRLAMQRARLYRRANRYYRNDGYLSYRERRRLARRYYLNRRNAYNSNRRNVYLYRRNW